MKSPYSLISLLFVLAMSGVEASTWTLEVNTMNSPQTPQPPQPPTLSAGSRTYTQQHFSGNGGSIDMQITGNTPTVNAHDDTRLDFSAGSNVRVTVQPGTGAASSVILWDASACTTTQSGQSRPCQVTERKQIIALIKQLPATPAPPAPPSR